MANKIQPRALAAIVGTVAAAGLLTLTPKWEGTKYRTYKDVAGVLTYCTGATESAIWGKTYTPAECKAQLDRDLARHAEGVMSCLHAPITDGQTIAYVDLGYNIGVDAFCHSTVARLANAGNLQGSCDAIMAWIKAGGVVVQGLVNRRTVDRDICLGKIIL